MKKKHIHLIGIKGVAMAALAVYLSEQNVAVTGSDVSEQFPTDEELNKRGITVYEGFDAGYIRQSRPDVVYYTGAHGGSHNPQVRQATTLGIPAFSHGKAMGEIMRGFRQVVIAGSHGKTTTSAMVASIFLHAGRDPSYLIGCGAISRSLPAGHAGKPPWFIAEGDEYVTDPTSDKTPRFLWTKPEILVVTNIDYDHPDVYGDLASVQEAFVALCSRSKKIIVNADDKNSAVLHTNTNHIQTFGFSPASTVRISRVTKGNDRMLFTLSAGARVIGEFAIRVPGIHNVSNATAAALAAHTAGISWDHIQEGLLAFTGTKRRFEKIGEFGGILVYDDYAHHPAEIIATLKACASWYPDRRIVAVFQPHTYSRTASLLSEFSKAFTVAGLVVICDIYASAREQTDPTISGSILASEVAKHHKHVYHARNYNAVIEHMVKMARRGDVIVCMGAGDIYTWADKMVRDLKNR